MRRYSSNANETRLRDYSGERGIPSEPQQINIEKVVKNYEIKITDGIFAPVCGLKYSDLEFFIRPTFNENLNNYLTHPVYITEYLIRKYKLFRGIEIDETKFDETAGRFDYWFAQKHRTYFILDQQANAYEVINSLLKVFFGFLYIEAGKIRISTYYKPQTITNVINNCLLDNSGLKSIKVYFDTDVYNDFLFCFNYEYNRNDFAVKLRVNKDVNELQIPNGENICANIYNQYGIQKEIKFDSKYGNPHHIDAFKFYTSIKMIIEIDLQIKDAIEYELGDYVKLNISDMLPSNYNNSKDFCIIGKEIDFSSKKIKLKLLEGVF